MKRLPGHLRVDTGKMIRVRQELCLTQQDLADQMGRSKYCICAWESEQWRPKSYEMLNTWANALGMCADDVLVDVCD